MSKTLIDHLEAIYLNQSLDYYDMLDDSEKKTYSVFMINRFISMHPSLISVVNEFQKLLSVIGPRESYLFYSQAIPKGKRYAKYIKGKAEKYETWLVDTVVRYFEVSVDDATSYIDMLLMTEGGKDNLRRMCEYFGNDPKLIEKIIG